MLVRPFRIMLLALALSALSACGKSTSPHAEATAAGISGTPGVHESTKRYRIDVTYPPLSPAAAVLADALQQRTGAARVQLKKALPDAKDFPELAQRPLRLMIAYKVTSRSPYFISVRELGMMDTGGAHPLPLDGTFVFDLPHKRLVSLDDLFADPAGARAALADFARKALYAKLLDKVPGGDRTPANARREWQDNMRRMIDAGTKPTLRNFGEFLVGAGGMGRSPHLTLVFSPYQVAPYVYGAQTVDVPLQRFAPLLKSGYRAAFGLEP